MSVDLYERYKEALRRGHMSLARGALEDAQAAYEEAISLAPDRPLPHAGLGQVFLRKGAPAEALVAFDTGLVRAPRDEVGLRGRGDALARLGRRTEAADTLDVLADIQEAAGRLGDACDTTRLALDLAEQKARRRRLQDLTRRLRLTAGDQPADRALARSMRPLRGGGSGTAAADTDAIDGDPADAGAAGQGSTRGRPAGRRRGAHHDDAVLPPGEPEPPPDPLALIAEAEAALDAGNSGAARLAYLAAAAAFEQFGLLNAALDACYVTLAFAPDDADVHLQLVELYLQLGWDAPAADKLALLGRLTQLDNRQGHARSRIVGLAADHFPDDPRLRTLSA